MTKAKQDSLNELRKSRNPEVKLFLELLIKFFTVQPTRVSFFFLWKQTNKDLLLLLFTSRFFLQILSGFHQIL